MSKRNLAYWKEWVERNEKAYQDQVDRMDRREALYQGDVREIEPLTARDTERNGDKRETSHLRNIICENIDLWGKVDGGVFVKDTLALKEGCVVNGNLHIKRLSVELGATFNGNCKMISDSEFDKVAGVQPKDTPAAPQARAN